MSISLELYFIIPDFFTLNLHQEDMTEMMAMGFEGFYDMHSSPLKREEIYDYKVS